MFDGNCQLNDQIMTETPSLNALLMFKHHYAWVTERIHCKTVSLSQT